MSIFESNVHRLTPGECQKAEQAKHEAEQRRREQLRQAEERCSVMANSDIS